MPLFRLVAAAIHRRAGLFAALAAEGTDCVRLFHGAVEGRPGLAVDRYGPVLLTQAWGPSITDEEHAAIVESIQGALGLDLAPVLMRHGEGDGETARVPRRVEDPRLAAPVGRELGLEYDVRPFHRGRDALLYLDLRCARRWVKANASGASVLNLFAYTCGIGVAALAGGASEAWNVDFAASALEIGRANGSRNGFGAPAFRTIEENVIPVVRQLAGLSLTGRAALREHVVLEPRTFDLVVLDPPRWAKTPWGAIDVVRDYPSLLKPAALCVAPGGRLLVTNHVPSVELEDFERLVRRTAQKTGREIVALDVLRPEEDFPSPDGRPPLKVLVVSLA